MIHWLWALGAFTLGEMLGILAMGVFAPGASEYSWRRGYREGREEGFQEGLMENE
jgi:hypothetical protein